jgi:hypothetical protein
MRSVGSPGRLARMSTAHRQVLTLEFDCVGMPLVGIVRDERGTGPTPQGPWERLMQPYNVSSHLKLTQNS